MSETVTATSVKNPTASSGKVTSTHVSGVGLNPSDYEARIATLAGLQNTLDTLENTKGSREPEAHAVHEKMVSAANNLKQMILAETDRQEYPPFTIKIDKTPTTPNKVTLTLRLEGIMDRKQAVPVMGELVRAFHRKRKNSTGASSVEDFYDEIHICDDSLHLHIDGIPHNRVEELLDTLAKPLEPLLSTKPALTITGAKTHLGAVHELVAQKGNP